MRQSNAHRMPVVISRKSLYDLGKTTELRRRIRVTTMLRHKDIIIVAANVITIISRISSLPISNDLAITIDNVWNTKEWKR